MFRFDELLHPVDIACVHEGSWSDCSGVGPVPVCQNTFRARDSFTSFREFPVFTRIAQILLTVQNVVDLLERSLIVQASPFSPLSLKS